MMASKDPNVLKGTTEDQTAEEVEEVHGVINPMKPPSSYIPWMEVLILMEAQIMAGEGKRRDGKYSR